MVHLITKLCLAICMWLISPLSVQWGKNKYYGNIFSPGTNTCLTGIYAHKGVKDKDRKAVWTPQKIPIVKIRDEDFDDKF